MQKFSEALTMFDGEWEVELRVDTILPNHQNPV